MASSSGVREGSFCLKLELEGHDEPCDKRRQRRPEVAGLSERFRQTIRAPPMNMFRGTFAKRFMQVLLLTVAAVKLYVVTHH